MGQFIIWIIVILNWHLKTYHFIIGINAPKCLVYCNTTDSGPVWGGGDEAGGMGRAEVVVTGSNWPGGVKGYWSFRLLGGGRGWSGGLKEGD